MHCSGQRQSDTYLTMESPKSEHNVKDKQQDTDIGMVTEEPVVKQERHEPEEGSNADSVISRDMDQGKTESVVTGTETGVPSIPVFQPVPPYGFGAAAIHPYFWPQVTQPNHYQDVWRSRPVLPSIPTRPPEAVGEASQKIEESVRSMTDQGFLQTTRESQFAIVPLLLEETNKVLLYNAYPVKIPPWRSKEMKTDVAFRLEPGVEGHIEAHWEGDLAPYGNRYVKVSKTRITSTCVGPVIITAMNKGEQTFHISCGEVIAEVSLYQQYKPKHVKGALVQKRKNMFKQAQMC